MGRGGKEELFSLSPLLYRREEHRVSTPLLHSRSLEGTSKNACRKKEQKPHQIAES